MRRQVAVVDYVRPACRFNSWIPDAILVGVTRLQVTYGKLFGGCKEETKRSDGTKWDTKGLTGGFWTHNVQ